MAPPKKSKKSKKDRKLKKNLSFVPVEPKAADSDWWDSFFNPRVLLFVERPVTFVQGNLPNSMVYRNVEQYPNAKQCSWNSQILKLEIDAPIYSANTNDPELKIGGVAYLWDWERDIPLCLKRHTGCRELDEGIVATCSASDGNKKRNTSFKKINSDAGACLSDYAVNEFVHVVFKNGATTTHRRSKVSNSTFHLTQLQWHHSQYDLNVTFQEEAWFDSVSILESDSDDDFVSIHGDGFPLASNPVGNISRGQVLQHERSARFVDNECKYEEYQSYMKIDGGKSDKIIDKDERRESNRFSLINTQGYELSHLGKADEVCCKRKNILDHSYGSFKGLTEDGRDSNEKIQDNALKSGLSPLVPSVLIDVSVCPKKIHHIAQPPELPKVKANGKVFIVNIQLPTYLAAMFLGDSDGERMSLDNIKDSTVPFRERLKILTGVLNPEDLGRSSAKKKLVHAYNDKPVFSRPRHNFYKGPKYFEIDMHIHRFSYISSKGLELF
ncbi:unnamed protein product [Prunus armeniaca]